jgi:SAM-dependent methyltransferase
MSILDVGCGNGRFGQFAIRQAGPSVDYFGIDSNARLLEHARAALTGSNIHLEQRDIIDPPLTLTPDAGPFDLIVLFGVIHHVPGFSQRQDFLHSLATLLAPSGLLAFAAWRFYEYPRFRDRLIPWPEDYEVEKNDYLLDWQRGARAIRYCHYVDDAEHEQLITATGLTVVEDYRADGESGDANRHTILQWKPE